MHSKHNILAPFYTKKKLKENVKFRNWKFIQIADFADFL